MTEILTRQENQLKHDLLDYFHRQGSGSARGFDNTSPRKNGGSIAIHEMLTLLTKQGYLTSLPNGMYTITTKGREAVNG